TATNQGGGGSNPLYLFARGRGLDTVLQAEGAQNTLTIDPSTLRIGNNEIYVRMKTSDTCYTQQTGIDSILLTRSTVTGITDVEFPGQVINATPNPFNDLLIVTGLQTIKTYSLSLVNASGQTIMTQRVEGQSSYIMHLAIPAKGMYYLRVFDETRHRS